ncbi:MAG: hypothetical protein R3F34_02475 [Planctomycetota bacterium]
MSISLLCLLCAVAAALVGSFVGGATGWGIAAGGFLAAAVSGTSAAILHRTVRERPRQSFTAFVAGFAIKVGALLAMAVVFLAFPDLRERLDPTGLLATFAIVAVVLLAAGTQVARRELGIGRPEA